MRLADFIRDNREPILAEWEAFARTCTPASGAMGIPALRDHANEMLTVIAADLGTAQGGREQAAKSRGNAPQEDDEGESTANGIFNPMKPREPAANSPASGPTGNLGLGLYIAERIVTAHGGRIDVVSSEADGTTFTVGLPRRE